jgi:hypothetical protein
MNAHLTGPEDCSFGLIMFIIVKRGKQDIVWHLVWHFWLFQQTPLDHLVHVVLRLVEARIVLVLVVQVHTRYLLDIVREATSLATIDVKGGIVYVPADFVHRCLVKLLPLLLFHTHQLSLRLVDLTDLVVL